MNGFIEVELKIHNGVDAYYNGHSFSLKKIDVQISNITYFGDFFICFQNTEIRVTQKKHEIKQLIIKSQVNGI